jgi:hypothetical protein
MELPERSVATFRIFTTPLQVGCKTWRCTEPWGGLPCRPAQPTSFGSAGLWRDANGRCLASRQTAYGRSLARLALSARGRLEVIRRTTYSVNGNRYVGRVAGDRFLRALRGEEIPKADLKHLAKHLGEGVAHATSPHVPIALLGRFKRQVGIRLFFMPLALISASGIETGLWILRLVSYIERWGSRWALFSEFGPNQV